MEKKLVTSAILVLNFLILFILPSTKTLDINTWRLLCFSLLNFISLSYIFVNKDLSTLFFRSLKSRLSIIVIVFLVWGLISYTYAINQSEVIVRLLFFVNFYLTFLISYVLLSYNRFKFETISIFLSLVVIAQLSYSYSNYFQIASITQYTFQYNDALNGIFPNRNITAAIYLYHLPFLLYLIINKGSSNLIKLIAGLVSLGLLNMVFLMSARTSYVVLGVLFIVYLIIFLISKHKKILSYFGIYSILLLLSFFTSSLSLGSQNDAFVVNRVNTIDFQEESTNTRLRYYSYGLNHVFNNPIIGVGLGNWKITSIEKDKDNIISYVVPYTMHNDFLEVAVEIGVIGLLIYLSIFFYVLYVVYQFFDKGSLNNSAYIILSFLIIYIVDANINFPFTRISQQLYLAFMLALTLYLKDLKNEASK